MAASRRFRFGLRTLLAGLTFATVASWVLWDVRVHYQMYREQMHFEAAVKNINRNSSIENAEGALPRRHLLFSYGRSDMAGYSVYDWPNSIYLVYFPSADAQTGSRESFQVYRLSPCPRNYSAQTEYGRKVVRFLESQRQAADRVRKAAYCRDFYEMISSDLRDDLGFEYELVYSDPYATQ